MSLLFLLSGRGVFAFQKLATVLQAHSAKKDMQKPKLIFHGKPNYAR